MDGQSKKLLEDTFLREIADPRIRKVKENVEEDSQQHRKAELPVLYLSAENQKLIIDILKYLHGPNFKLSSAASYKDKGNNLSNKYWIARGNLVVQGGCDYSIMKKDPINDDITRMKNFAIARLEKYNFHRVHCVEAFEESGQNLEKALNVLYNKYFDIESNTLSDVPSEDELKELRDDEIEVLQSIYDTSFLVKDPNLWVVNVDLKYLEKAYKTPSVEHKVSVNKSENGQSNKKMEKCKLYLKGPCRFGEKCRFLHEKPTDKPVEKIDENNTSFEIEIRFPTNSKYPYEPPLIFLKNINNVDGVSNLKCLQITVKLLEEAKSSAEMGTPSIYSIVELLKNEEEILNSILFCTKKFPDPTDSLFVKHLEEEMENNKPKYYSKVDKSKNKKLIDLNKIEHDNEKIVSDWNRKVHGAKSSKDVTESSRYNKMVDSRKKLPAWNEKENIISAINKSQVVVISGETGCGKSTQVPQFILDHWLDNFHGSEAKKHINIVCTQPRRISAIGVAERVADERVEPAGQTVGYQIRLESKISSRTRLTFCTTGILLRRLESDPQLTSVTHILVDEVHERSEESDFLLLILRDLIKVRKDLKVVLMSATMNTQLFSDYFGGIPVLELPGRTFPVEDYYLEHIMEMTNYVLEENGPFARKIKKGDKEKKSDINTELETCDVRASSIEPPKVTIRDENLTVPQTLSRYSHVSKTVCKNLYFSDYEKINYELIEHVLLYIVEGEHKWPREGAILIFLPGISEIMALHEQLSTSSVFNPKNGNYVLVPLHSTLSSAEQSLVFKKVENYQRKIVLSTNIAETSVTIDDCVFVIDCGKMKEKRFDSNRNMESLELVWESRANAKQRRGRAGRVMAGVCIHLFTSHRYNYHLAEQPVPEIHRIPLEQMLLQIISMPMFENMSVHEVLGRTIEPPTASSINDSLTRLQDVGALDKKFSLTALGRHLSELPVDVRIGKLILFGAIFCCVDSTLTIAACLSHSSPFVAPFGKKNEADAKRRQFAYAHSDQLTMLRAYRKWQEKLSISTQAAYTFASENFLSHKTLLVLADIKRQLLGLLSSIGFVPFVPDLRRKVKYDNVAVNTGPELNANGDNERILVTILCAALYPNVVKVLTPEKSFHMQAGGAVPRQPLPEELRFKTKSDGYVSLHPSSINANEGYFPSPYLVYQEKVKTSRIFIRDCSVVPQLPLVLFSGCDLSVELHNGLFVLSLDDGWIMFQVENHEVAEMLKSIRESLVDLLEEKINSPNLNLLNYEKGRRIINAIVQVISST